jgi:LEA14-like dessication related protein
MVSRLALLVCLAVAACTPTKSPELRVIGVHDAARHEVVFVQVTNPASRPMKLTKLEYTFAAGSSKLSEGELPLSTEVPASSAIVVEVPLEISSDGESPAMTLTGKLTAELDEIVRTFNVSAKVDAHGQPK